MMILIYRIFPCNSPKRWRKIKRLSQIRPRKMRKNPQQKATSGANNKTTSTEKESSKSKESEKGEASGKDEDNPDNDPTLFTQSEIDLLQELSDRREQIEKMSKQISLREGLLKAAEKRISKRVSELKQLQKTINDLIKTHDDQQETKMASLVKIYEAMKPKDAARIFEQLDLRYPIDSSGANERT